MNKILGLIVAVFGAVTLFTDDSEASIEPVKNIPSMDDPRGIRNNNPGNIKKSSNTWLGKISNGKDKTFEVFIEPEYGIRAMTKIFRKYFYDYSLTSIRQILNRYAPDSENPTSEYIDFVSDHMAIDADDTINIDHDMFGLISAVIEFEQGFNPYSNSIISRGISLA